MKLPLNFYLGSFHGYFGLWKGEFINASTFAYKQIIAVIYKRKAGMWIQLDENNP